jgi:hypothetical protein
MIVRGFEMEKGVDFIDNFSPTPSLAVARLMMSIAIANGMELHKIDIEQAFLQADKLDEGVNGRYFINPLPGSPEAGNKDVVYEVMKPLYGRLVLQGTQPHEQRTLDACHSDDPSHSMCNSSMQCTRPIGHLRARLTATCRQLCRTLGTATRICITSRMS